MILLSAIEVCNIFPKCENIIQRIQLNPLSFPAHSPIYVPMPTFVQPTYPYAGEPGVEPRLADLLAPKADNVIHQEPGVVLPVQTVYHHLLEGGGGARSESRTGRGTQAQRGLKRFEKLERLQSSLTLNETTSVDSVNHMIRRIQNHQS